MLDEPTAGLDPIGQEEIMNLVKKMNEEGKTIIFVTHDMDLVMKYSSRVIVMKDAKVVFDDSPSSLFLKENDEFSIEVPLIYKYAQELNKLGYHIDIKNIKNVDDIVKEIVKEKKK